MHWIHRNLRIGLLTWLIAGSLAGRADFSAPSLAPDNDNFANARVMAGATFTLEGDLATATVEPFETPAADELGRTLWWQWTAPSDGIVAWLAWNTSVDSPAISVTAWRHDALGQLTIAASSFRRARWLENGGLQIKADPSGSWQVQKGETYWISLDAAVPREPGSILVGSEPPGDSLIARVAFGLISTPPPANDSFARRELLVGRQVHFGGSLAAATSEAEEPLAVGDALGRTRWWSWTAPTNGTVKIENLGTQGAPVVVIYRIGTFNRLKAIASSATQFGNDCYRVWRGQETVEWDTVVGATYEIQVDRYPETAPTADYPLALNFTPAPANDDFADAQLLEGTDLSLSVNNFGSTRGSQDPVLPGVSGDGSVWFRWIAPQRGMLQVSTNAPVRYADPSFEIIPPGGSIYGSYSHTVIDFFPCNAPFGDLNPPPPFTPVFGLFNSFLNGGVPSYSLAAYGTNVIGAEVFPGDTRICLDSVGDVSGETRLNLLFTPPPPNDEYAHRIVLPSAPVAVGGRTFAATADIQQGYGSRSVWWEWSAPTAGLWVLRPKAWDGGHRIQLAPVAKLSAEGAFPDPTPTTIGDPLVFRAAAGQAFAVNVSTTDGGLGGNVSFALDVVQTPTITGQLVYEPWYSRVTWQLHWPASYGIPKVVETSTNLVDWEPLAAGSNVVDGEASLPFLETDERRFFRVSLIEPH